MKILLIILIADAILNVILSVVNYFIKRNTNKIIDDFAKEMHESEKSNDSGE